MKPSNWKTYLGAALFSGLSVFACASARAQDLGKPLLLVASPALKGPYGETALIVVPMADKHVGFILNRVTDTKLASAFPEHAPSAKVTDPIYFGGPEASDALFAVLRRDPGKPSIHLFADLFVTANRESIDRIIEQTPNDARYFAGFVRWTPGELAEEIGKGLWYVTEPDPGFVFRPDTSGMWEELVKRLGNGRSPRRGPGLLDAHLSGGPA